MVTIPVLGLKLGELRLTYYLVPIVHRFLQQAITQCQSLPMIAESFMCRIQSSHNSLLQDVKVSYFDMSYVFRHIPFSVSQGNFDLNGLRKDQYYFCNIFKWYDNLIASQLIMIVALHTPSQSSVHIWISYYMICLICMFCFVCSRYFSWFERERDVLQSMLVFVIYLGTISELKKLVCDLFCVSCLHFSFIKVNISAIVFLVLMRLKWLIPGVLTPAVCLWKQVGQLFNLKETGCRWLAANSWVKTFCFQVLQICHLRCWYPTQYE